MYDFLNILEKLFISLNDHPEKQKEIGEMIKDTLNNGFKGLICENIFISRGTDISSIPVNIIPIMPTTDILEINNLKYYDIELNLTAINNADNVSEITAWLIHEISENLITDNTLVRFKKMLIKYYNHAESGIKSVIRTIGYLTWIGIFSRTKKSYIDEMSTDFFSSFLKNNGLDNYIAHWNNALKKYVSTNGGDTTILTDSYIENKDKSEFLTFNKLARRYSAYAVKYNDTTYSTFTKYIIASEKSELLKFYIEREPKHLAIFKEKEIFNIFDDNKILHESTETELLEGTKTRSFVKEFSELSIDVDNVISTSDKLKVAVKLKEFQLDLTKAIYTDLLNKEVLQDLREKTNILVNKLNKVDTVPAVMEEFI